MKAQHSQKEKTFPSSQEVLADSARLNTKKGRRKGGLKRNKRACFIFNWRLNYWVPLSVLAEGTLKHGKPINDLTRASRTTHLNTPPWRGSNSTCAMHNYFYGCHGFLNRLRTTLWTKVWLVVSHSFWCCVLCIFAAESGDNESFSVTNGSSFFMANINIAFF